MPGKTKENKSKKKRNTNKRSPEILIHENMRYEIIKINEDFTALAKIGDKIENIFVDWGSTSRGYNLFLKKNGYDLKKIIKSLPDVEDLSKIALDAKKHGVIKTKEILEWVYCIIIAIVLALLFRYFIGTPTIVQQVSMYPTLEQDQRLWLNRWSRTTKTLPERGKIITFEAPTKKFYTSSEIDTDNPIAQYENEPTNIFGKFVKYVLEIGKESYIKRVIGLPGEHIEYKDNTLYVDGKKVKENFKHEKTEDFNIKELGSDTVPEGSYLVLGDNRENSLDSRELGFMKEEQLLGRTNLIILPFDRIGNAN